MYIVHCHTHVLLRSHLGLSRRSHLCACASQSPVSHGACVPRAPHFCVVSARTELCAPPVSLVPWPGPACSRQLSTLPCTARPPALLVRPIRLWPTRKAVPGLPFYCSVMKESERDLGTRSRISPWTCWCGQRFCHRCDDLWRRFSVEGSARG